MNVIATLKALFWSAAWYALQIPAWARAKIKREPFRWVDPT